MVSVLLALLAAATQVAALSTSSTPPSLADLPRGEPAAVGSVVDDTWDLPRRHGLSSVTPYDGGHLVTDTRFFEGSLGIVRVAADGRPVRDEAVRRATGGFPVVADDGRVAWTGFVGLESGKTGPSLVYVDGVARSWPGNVPMSVGGFVGDDVVVNQGLTVSRLDPAGGATPLRHLTYASDTTGTLVAGALGRRGGVVEAGTGDVLWRARGHDLAFSPSGRRVAMRDRDGVVVRRTADGGVLWRAALPGRGYVDQLVWEDGRRLLAVATQRNHSTVLRIGRGRLERATPVVAAHNANRSPFLLTSR